jgi:AAA family ATP:ADP antiporter
VRKTPRTWAQFPGEPRSCTQERGRWSDYSWGIYANDIVSTGEADRLYGPVGIGGTIGGIVGGASVDSLVRVIGPIHLLLLSAALCLVSGMVVWAGERALRPRPRRIDGATAQGPGAGWHEVARSEYLLLIVGVVVTYEFAAAMTDFVVNVVFERAFSSEIVLAQMFGRLGWIVSATALVSQVLLVPVVLPLKRFALLIPPVVMGIAAIGLAFVPIAAMAILMSTADRGLNYSLQQAAKETLYVPLSDSQKYKGKAVIDMVLDRLGKAASAIALILLMTVRGMSIPLMLGVALAAIALWVVCAWRLGHVYAERTAEQGAGIPSAA